MVKITLRSSKRHLCISDPFCISGIGTYIEGPFGEIFYKLTSSDEALPFLEEAFHMDQLTATSKRDLLDILIDVREQLALTEFLPLRNLYLQKMGQLAKASI